MIHIYVFGLTEAISKAIEGMMASVDIKPHFYNIVDVNKGKIAIDDKRNLLAIGKKATFAVVNALVNEEYIEKGTYVGKPLIDEDNAFFFYGIHLEIPEIMSNDENKFYVFEILQDLSKYYLKWNPFNDEVNFGTTTSGVVETAEEVIHKAEQAIVNTQYGIQIDEKIDTLELIGKLVEKVDFSDAGLGKSLSKFDKIQLVTNNGYKLNISPTARDTGSDDPKEIDLSYKDLLSLLKVIILTGSRTIEFFKDES